jgi:hypothetical protein
VRRRVVPFAALGAALAVSGCGGVRTLDKTAVERTFGSAGFHLRLQREFVPRHPHDIRPLDWLRTEPGGYDVMLFDSDADARNSVRYPELFNQPARFENVVVYGLESSGDLISSCGRTGTYAYISSGTLPTGDERYQPRLQRALNALGWRKTDPCPSTVRWPAFLRA